MAKVKTEPEYVKRKYLSVSTLLAFDRCPRRYFYQKSGLQQGETPLAPQYGTAMHKAVPIALQTGDFDRAMAGFLSVWEEVEEQQAETGDSDPKRNRRCAERSLKHFIFTHSGTKSLYKLIAPPVTDIVVDEKTSDYEVPWAIDIGLPIPLLGRFDAFCQHRDTGETWIWEFKTGSRINARFFEAHEMSPQNLTYCLAGRTLVGENIQGVMVEGMLVDKGKVDNMLQPVPVMMHHLGDMLSWLQITGQRLLDAEAYYLSCNPKDHPEAVFEKNFSMCTSYSHFYMPGFRCEYADLCRVPDWRSLTALYRVVPDHDFLKVSIDADAARKVGATE